MMKRLTQTISLLVLLVHVVSGPVHAREGETRHYLPAGSVDADAVIQPPPAVGSAAFKEQLAIVLWLQRTRTPAQVEFVQKPLNLERFVPLFDVDLVGVDGMALKRVIDAAIDEVRAEYDALKGRFDVPRPFEVSDAVEPIAESRAVAAYPSGHAIRAMIYARLLSEIFPERKEALVELARQIGYGRVIAGVHYPMDVLAGQKLGEAYADAIVARSQFKQAIECIHGRQPCQ